MGSDNGSNFLDNEKDPIGDKCPTCGFLMDTEYYNPFFKLKRKVFDYSECYDLGNIVSLKFKEFCGRQGYSNLRFREFDHEPNFFLFTPITSVKFDTEKAGTEFEKKCETCGNYQEVFGTLPAGLLNESEVLADGFYRTDTLFGFGNKRHPLIIVSPITVDKLRKEKMKGLYFDPLSNGN